MAGCGATGQQDIAPVKEFFTAVEELSKLERPSLHPDDFYEFVGVRYKKLSTNQTRGITWISPGLF